MEVDPLLYTACWKVRGYELESNGHVNNSVYLNWAEEVATLHAEAAGYGRQRSRTAVVDGQWHHRYRSHLNLEP